MVKVVNFPGVHKRRWGPPPDFGRNVLDDYLAWEVEQIEAENLNRLDSENHGGTARGFRHYVNINGKKYWPRGGYLVRGPVWLWKMKKYLSSACFHE